MSYVARAEIVARLAHQGQVDKGGVDYAEHLKAVATAVADETQDERAIAAAWLHDTVEDTPLHLHDLEQLGFPQTVVNVVRLLTHTHEHTHDDYLREIRDFPGPVGVLARIVKRADLNHNADLSRARPADRGWIARRYARARAIMEGDIP